MGVGPLLTRRRGAPTLCAAVIVLSMAGAAHSSSSKLPVRGERYHGVRQSNIQLTICVSGWTSTIRPPTAYTSALKRWLLKDRHLPGSTSDYQLDHVLSLGIGGAPYSTDNLAMVPIAQASRDDQLEGQWHRQICSGALTLRAAQVKEVAYKQEHD